MLVEDYPLVDRPPALRTLGDITSSIIVHPRFDYLAWDDPMPFVQDIRNILVGDGEKWNALAIPDRQLPSPLQCIGNAIARR